MSFAFKINSLPSLNTGSLCSPVTINGSPFNVFNSKTLSSSSVSLTQIFLRRVYPSLESIWIFKFSTFISPSVIPTIFPSSFSFNVLGIPSITTLTHEFCSTQLCSPIK